MCCADQAIFVRFLFEVCWLLSFFRPEVPVQGELVRARGSLELAVTRAGGFVMRQYHAQLALEARGLDLT